MVLRIEPRRVPWLNYIFLGAAVLTSAVGCAIYSPQWMQVSAPQNRKIHMAVFRPPGDKPFPVVVVLHGNGGLRERHVELARHFSENGFIGVAACWFRGHFRGIDPPRPVKFRDAVDCPDGPDIKPRRRNRAAVVEDLRMLIDSVKRLTSVRPDRIGLFGHSSGSGAALVAATSGISVQAVVATAGFPRTDLQALLAPVLMLQGTADAIFDPQRMRNFEQILRSLGKPFEVHYYEGAPHGIPWLAPWQEDVRRRSVNFFKKHLVR